MLAQRAKAEGVEEIRSAADLVPLLFPHTTYKSYPESNQSVPESSGRTGRAFPGDRAEVDSADRGGR
ncbi:hypothetical protein [Pseudofrankia sp. DC12]|uniref:hypothetical protein n=1 Tax=Pseudofrankia sp. DC12 TaxID=683315 RepID=UPI0005F896B1|nr:hypothetical protein [Pseudofrankia sp. DC12]